jgi:hypothetical protein
MGRAAELLCMAPQNKALLTALAYPPQIQAMTALYEREMGECRGKWFMLKQA